MLLMLHKYLGYLLEYTTIFYIHSVGSLEDTTENLQW